ncbi:troponin T, skeletal muscle-like isoform X1 [Pollicipes pollicipes]|uniref:troponin T, skeletal muscle-like isoform X1 n=1 Tax=Pollicipes pollicipes TaxID=41117 RepID=UPI001884E6BF|nr:troponin T, skeletal muscle-like isoform X1 [Pollicipes pollicipes]
MSDDEVYSSEEEEEVVKHEEPKPAKPEEKKEENIFTHRPQTTTSELDEQLKEYIAEWRKQRAKEEDELKNLRAKQAKRKVLRAEEEKRLAAAKKVEDERRLREEQEKKQREQEEKRRRLEEAEKKRQLLEQASKATAGGKIKISKSNDPVSAAPVKAETKTKEQLAEEKKMALGVRIQALKTEGMGLETLKKKAEELWNKLVQLETDKYDLEERQKRQDYDLKELKERQKMQLRHKAVRLGLEPEALTGKHPPKIQVASKFERTIDRRTYVDKKGLFSGGWDEISKEQLQKEWGEKYEDWTKRNKTRLPKWFGERPGKKTDDPETPVEEEKEEELVPPPQEIEEPEIFSPPVTDLDTRQLVQPITQAYMMP